MEPFESPQKPRRYFWRIASICLLILAVACVACIVLLFQGVPQRPPFDKRILAIAIPPNTPHVNIQGTVYLPDGSPIFNCGVTADTAIFVLRSPDTYSQNGSFFGQHHTSQDGTFQFNFRSGANAVITAFGRDDSEYRQFASKPVVFVARENMEPITITLEEGIPVRGRLLYDNGTPAPLHALEIRQHIEPILGADIPTVREVFRSTRQHKVNDAGEFEVFLLPGGYTFATSDWKGEQPLTIVPTDTEKQFDVKIRTPIFVEAYMEDGTRVKNAIYSFSSNVRAISSGGSMMEQFYDGALLLEPVSHHWTLYLKSWEGDHGTIETITPAMIGKTMRFTLKPVGRVALTAIDANGRPAAGLPVYLSIMQNTHTQLGDNTVTDAEGKAVLRILPGKVSVMLSVGSQRVDRRLDVVSGETIDIGTMRLRRR
ncbi:MAG: carboxypeptidase-like regulatory domain-containing protein [Planctomycetaceae bacterium]|nr:carboxypeptidase-like regulatory domain-containing protein [Planctomycetaceae bacterium]